MLSLLFLVAATYVAAAISGAAGFGGALLLLPLLVGTVGSVHAVPLLTITQFIGNISRACFGFSRIQWRSVGLFLVTAVPLSALGAFSFIGLSKVVVTRCVGSVLLMAVGLKYYGLLELKGGPFLLIAGGGVVGFLSGRVGSAGPLGAAVFLTLNLDPVAYVASEAITALVMHGVKMSVYQHYVPMPQHLWLLAGFMSLAMILGTWSSKRLIEKLPREKFQKYVAYLLVVIGIYMVLHG